MKKRLLIFVLMQLFVFTLIYSGDQSSVENLKPRAVTELSGEGAFGELVVECNVPGSEVYLNSIYQGKTKLKIRNLLPAQYILEVRKEGFKSQKYLVEAKKHYSYNFYVMMEEIEKLPATSEN